MYVVQTQVLENYGAHCNDGKFSSGNAYWKMKGGDTYIVNDLERMQDATAYVMAAHGSNEISWKEYPCHTQTLSEWYEYLDTLDEDHKEFLLKIAKRVSPKWPGNEKSFRLVG